MKQYNNVDIEDIFHEVDFTKPVRFNWSNPHSAPQVFFSLNVIPEADDSNDADPRLYWLCIWHYGHGAESEEITFVRIALDTEEILHLNNGMEERMKAALKVVSI
jgi:hypothetical protein